MRCVVFTSELWNIHNDDGVVIALLLMNWGSTMVAHRPLKKRRYHIIVGLKHNTVIHLWISVLINSPFSFANFE